MSYSADGVSELTPASIDELPAFPPLAGVAWLDVDGVHDLDLIRALGTRLSIHPLVLEDIVTTGQRSKVEPHEGYLYIVLPALSLDEATGAIDDEQISLLVGPNYVVSLQERPGDEFNPVRARIRNESARIRAQESDYLAYALIDAIVDHYFAVLESFGDAAEQVEIEVVTRPQRDTMHRLHTLKRQLLLVRRAVWPVRDMISGLLRSETPLITESTRVYLRDVYDHSIRIIETVEVLRDVSGGVMDLYLSSISHRTNEVMKTLTVMASIFIPLTFIVGVYGMNFEFMPELQVWWAYPVLMLFMAAVAAGMLGMFRWRGWL